MPSVKFLLSILFGALLLATAGAAGAPSERNRAEGWQHAKRTGHANEDRIEKLLLSDAAFAGRFLARVGEPGRKIVKVSGGGLGEAHVPSVFKSGEPTTPKADVYVELDDGRRLTFSIKKSPSGQVYLVTVGNFIEAYEAHYAPIPERVKRAIRLFWGSADDVEKVVDAHGVARTYEKRKHRAVAGTIRAYDPALHDELLKWFTDNAGNLADLCFARGGARNPADWAQFVWYRNELGENPLDRIFRIGDVRKAAAAAAAKTTAFGKVNGGSTIQLPFGFVQWHSPQKTFPGSMQFHHRLECLERLAPPRVSP